VKSQRNIPTKQGLDITGAEDIRSHATTIIATSTTKYETHSCTSDGKKKATKEAKKKSPSRATEKIPDERGTSTKGKHSTIGPNNTKQEERRQRRLSRKQEKGLDGQTRRYLLYMSLEQGEPRRGIPYFLGHEQCPCNTMR